MGSGWNNSPNSGWGNSGGSSGSGSSWGTGGNSGWNQGFGNTPSNPPSVPSKESTWETYGTKKKKGINLDGLRNALGNIPPSVRKIGLIAIAVILVIVVAVTFINGNGAAVQKMNNALSNLVSLLVTWMVGSAVIWGILMFVAGRHFPGRLKIGMFFACLIIVAVCHFIPALGSLLAIIGILYVLFKMYVR